VRATVEALRSTEADPEEPPTVSELNEPWGAVRKWASSQKIETGFIESNLPRAVSSSRNSRSWGRRDARCQYKQLRVLEAADVPRIARAEYLALLPAMRLLPMESVPAKAIEILGLPYPVITT
jgi:hypothetical protein